MSIFWYDRLNSVNSDRMLVGARDATICIVEHPHQEKYRGQRILIVRMHDYAWLVPFVETRDEVFLKTIIPSRKATRDYLGGR